MSWKTTCIFYSLTYKICHIETTYPDNINLKLAFHKVAAFHPHYLTFTLQTDHHTVHRFRSRPAQMISPSHSTNTAKKYIQPYLHNVFARTNQNNLILNPDKTTSTLFTPDPAEYTSNLDLKTMHYPWQSTQRFWVLL